MKLLIVSAPFKQRFFEEMSRFMRVEMKIISIDDFYDKHGFMFPTRKVWNMICSYEPDVILSDCLHYPQFYAKLYSKKKRKKMAIMTHLRGNFWIETDYYFRSILRRKFWKDNTYRSNWLLKVIEIPVFYFHHMFLANRAIRLSDCILPICRWLEGEVKKKMPRITTEVLYQGINPSLFFDVPPLEWEHPAVGILQNHSIYPKTRGLIDFFRVIERLPYVHFYIAGGESWGTGYFSLVRKALGKYPNVHFTGEVGYPEGVRTFLSSCDVYALPSGLDCCPTTLLEASMCGKPVLGSRVGGIPEIVREGETGWTIPNENVDEWVEKITLLLEDTKLRRRMGQNGKRFVEEQFSWQVIARRLEGIMESYAG